VINGMPRVSVIIPTYNRERFVVKAIRSALNQSLQDREIIVVDDGSTDRTRRALEPYRSRIQYIYQDNAGVSAARNAGIKAARGEWLAFLDSDDEWTPEYLTKQTQWAGEAPGVCMQTADCLLVQLNGKTTRYFEISRALPEFKGEDYLFVREPFRFVIEHGPWQVGATIIRSDAIRSAGLFDTNLRISEDLDLMARVALQGPFGMVREALVYIYRREESTECLTQQAKNNPLQARESDELLYEKLARIEALKPRQRRALNAVMSANRRAIGNLLLKDGRMIEAKNCFKRALSMDHSMRSLGKYVLSLPGAVSRRRIPALDGEGHLVKGGKVR
jgi:glycosyltransferase involved in cell wall biosynthesis